MPTDPTTAQVLGTIRSSLRLASDIDGGTVDDNEAWWLLGIETMQGGIRLDLTNVENPTDATPETIRSFLIAAIPVDAPREDTDPQDVR